MKQIKDFSLKNALNIISILNEISFFIDSIDVQDHC